MSTPATLVSPGHGAPPVATHPLQSLARITRCDIGESVYCQEAPAEYWYRIMEGAARQCALLADGRRQIVDFLFAGDLFGWGERSAHQFSVEVIVAGTRVARYPRRHIEMLADSNAQVRRQILDTAFQSIARLQTRMVLLGRTSAIEKVSAFLLEMADRCGERGADAVVLPMSRYDIADYLAMAVETVSRTLTELKRRDAIVLRGTRCVQIVRRDALEVECVTGISH